MSSSSPQTGVAGDYDVGVQVSEAGGGATWTYTITKAADTAKDLGHFILNFETCGEQSPKLANITAATVNGVNWLGKLEASDGKTGCKVDPGTSSSSTTCHRPTRS